MTYGQTAYEAYFAKCGGKSLISGSPLPEWSAQSLEIRQAWEAAGRAVAEQVREEES
jgi:hypothetical protein